MTPLEVEVQSMLSVGCRQVTFRQLKAEFAVLGYKLADPCNGTGRNLTTGNIYPARTYDPIQSDGMSAFHYQARRDDNFKAIQELRLEVFAVVNGRIVTV